MPLFLGIGNLQPSLMSIELIPEMEAENELNITSLFPIFKING